MAKALVITEKPSVARDIAAALRGFEEHDGYFESPDLVVSFAVGHLYELLEPEELDPKYKRWLLDDLPILPAEFKLKPKSGQAERIRVLKRLAQRPDVDRIVNACDAGREGELIFREILKNLGVQKPVRRLWLQSMTDQAIRDGFAHLRQGDEFEGLGAAAECRAYSDWLIGMNATRALTKRLKSRKEKTAWSAGRVQTPTLALLVDKEHEVLSHVPRPYWRVTARFENDGQGYDAIWFDPRFEAGDDGEARDDRLFDEARARAIVDAVRAAPRALASETRKPSRESAPPLFDLTSLQREANRRFGWSAKRALGAAQRCYEQHKILTYPRTDSRCLPEDYREVVDRVLESFAEGTDARQPDPALADYAAAAERLRRDGRQNEGRIFDNAGVSDHFAIIPTGVLPGPHLSGDDRRLYDLVTRRFLGAFHPAALWMRVERTTEVAGESFRTRARTLQEPGWRAVLAMEKEEDEAVLPPLRPGADEARDVAVASRGAELEASETKPPARITEARLLSLMENAGEQIDDEDLAAVLHEKGIGTPATRADIIENLIGKGYAQRVGKALRPTVKGMRLIDILKRIHVDRLASAKLTGEIETHLLEVERGRRRPDDYLKEIADYAEEIVDRTRGFEFEDVYPERDPLGDCPRCHKPVYERSWFYRCPEQGDPAEDCPVRIWKDTSGRYIDRAAVRALLRDGRTGVLDGFTARDGRTYKGRLEFDPETFQVKVRSEGASEDGNASGAPEYEVNPEPLGVCPRGEGCRVVESPSQFVCERRLLDETQGKDESRPKSCGFVLPRTVCKREITREEALVYLANGKTDLLTDFTSRFGRPFSATLVLKENGRHGFEFPPRAPRAPKGKAAVETGEGAAEVVAEAAPARGRRGKRAPAAEPARAARPAKKKAAARTAPRRKAAGTKARARGTKAKPGGADGGAGS
ncbi:MAG TPA: DNA topoisomerase III [Myxococcota bacterium]|nr:DNA topoisomerase III [Myxococcota bacterium]